ncbi:MAG: hypothetical protein DSM106950_21095 [Stigonema ocellatum SAG 48.90 = DSM 106950]|nr:hypothetical protein [Stigonema ocellatum SAG 48.90 = DSM 106950]
MKSLASSGDADFGISWKELQQKFLSLNGGKPGFYCYGHGEAKYFKSADLA